MSQTCVIVGASHAGGQLAFSLRQQGWDGRIVLVGDEPSAPYHRPPLSKGFLVDGSEVNDILIRKAEAYAQKDIEMMLNTRVAKIDREAKQLRLENGDTLAYDKLALCLGASVRKLEIPGHELDGIHYLRSAQDADAIRADLQSAKTAVIVGGGYIGLELAASLRKKGIQVTLLETQNRILARVTAEEISQFYTEVHRIEGVAIHTDMAVTEFTGEGRVTGVQTADGQQFPADIVFVGIGVNPNTELAAEAGLAIENGIVVDEFATTDDPDIVAAGDCTYHPNPILGRRIRLESVPNTMDQAKAAAASIIGKTQIPYSAIPWFWSEQYDMKLQMAGLNQGFDRVILRGKPDKSRSFAAFYLKDDRVIGVDCVNRPKEFMIVKNALNKGLQLGTDKLADESIDAKDLLSAA